MGDRIDSTSRWLFPVTYALLLAFNWAYFN